MIIIFIASVVNFVHVGDIIVKAIYKHYRFICSLFPESNGGISFTYFNLVDTNSNVIGTI